MIKASVLQGESSKWNFGSYFGLTFEEFIDRIRPVADGNPYWNTLSGLVQYYNVTTAKKDFEFILNCAAHISDMQQVRNTCTCLLYGTEPYIPTTKPNLIDQFDCLSISK